MSNFEDSILRVMKGDAVVGAAFLFSDRLVATCAHVVQSARAEVGQEIFLHSSDGKEIKAIVEHEFWRDPNAEDIAILRLDEAIENIQPVILGPSSGTKGHKFSTIGFPNKRQELTGSGEIVGQATLNGIRLLQLDSRQVTPGFSGAPVFDEVTKRTVGIVVAITPPDEYQRLGTTAFAIPSETIREICSELQISDICPYRSLDVFNEEDAPFFFGRDRVVQKMVDSLKREPRFLAVLGPSGSGKSSVVRAGLIPALKQGKVLGSGKWGVIIIRPANQPFEQLDSAGLSQSQEGLESSVRAWLANHTEKKRLILVIDQFEELLVSTPEDIRQKFIKELANLLDSSIAITVILTLRDDFYSRFLLDASAMANWLERGLVNIPTTLDEDELRAMIIEPANVVGLTFEEGLVEVILDDAAEADRTNGIARSTVLPLLEFALTQLWERRQEGMLTHDAYNAIDGVTGGLTQWAGQVYYSLTSEEREIARHLLSELVRPGNEEQGIPDTRRVRTITNLMHKDQTLSQWVIDRLVRVRLLSTWRDEETGLEKIEIIHDTLLREWGLLRDWMTENRIFLAWRDGLETQIRRWEESNKNEGALLQGLQLIEAEEWLATRKDDINATGQQFIETGIAVREKEKADKERLYQQTVRQLEHLEALREIDLAISSTFDLRLTVKMLLEKVIGQLGVGAADLLLFNATTGRLDFVAGLGFYTSGIERSSLSLGQDIAGKAALERRTVRVENLMEGKETFSRHQVLADEGFVSYVGVPLIAKGLVKGVLEIFHRSALNSDAEWLNFLETLAGQAAIATENAILFEDLQRSNQELLLAYDATIVGLISALDLRDKETEGHTKRVTDITLRLAREMDIRDEQLIQIRRGSLLHDIGKIGVSDTVLHKPGKLTEDEWQIMRRHPEIGARIVDGIPFLQEALPIIRYHHERWDGSGYPYGLTGKDIPIQARIFAVADAYDALTSTRLYRKKSSGEEALQYLREQAGVLFDPQVIEIFAKLLQEEQLEGRGTD